MEQYLGSIGQSNESRCCPRFGGRFPYVPFLPLAALTTLTIRFSVQSRACAPWMRCSIMHSFCVASLLLNLQPQPCATGCQLEHSLSANPVCLKIQPLHLSQRFRHSSLCTFFRMPNHHGATPHVMFCIVNCSVFETRPFLTSRTRVMTHLQTPQQVMNIERLVERAPVEASMQG